jgi:hypothetical protein
MDPSRAVRSGAELGTNCTGDAVEGSGGAGGEDNSIKPVNIKIKIKKLDTCMVYIVEEIHVPFRHCETHLS